MLYKNVVNRNFFTVEEDKKLIELVNIFGKNEWKVISRLMGTRSVRQCRDRFNGYLDPRIKNIPWKASDDDKLLELYTKYGPKWSVISKHFDNRSDTNVRNRFKKMFGHLLNKEKEKYDADLSDHKANLPSIATMNPDCHMNQNSNVDNTNANIEYKTFSLDILHRHFNDIKEMPDMFWSDNYPKHLSFIRKVDVHNVGKPNVQMINDIYAKTYRNFGGSMW